MRHILERTAIALVVVISIVLVLAVTRPDTYEVRRTASIKAPPERIFPLINDLHAFNTWNPYEKKDPSIRGRYTGAASGKGAAYAFEGSKEVGKGSLEIVHSSPVRRVTMNLRMLAPVEASNVVDFVLEPAGDGTDVTWAMHGRVPYLARVVHLFVDVDDMVGRDFEAGLATLKGIVESPQVAARTN